MEPLISIIVPVYGVESYLDRCIQSIVNQTYRKLEIILVDDGSPDHCGVMCDIWAEKDSRIRVIHKSNGGLSDARNAGMEVATGELMGFIDSDDWIEPEMYTRLWELMKRDQADIAACGVRMVWENGTESRLLTKSGECVLSRQEAMVAIIEETALKQPVWYKLYRSCLIQDIPFAKGKCHEDVYWSYQAIGKAERVAVCDEPYYNYLQRNGSIMNNKFSLQRLDGVRAKILRQTYLEMYFPGLTGIGRIDLLFYCLYQGQMFLRDGNAKEKENALAYLAETVRCVKLTREDLCKMSWTHRIWARMAVVLFRGTCRIRNWMHIGC